MTATKFSWDFNDWWEKHGQYNAAHAWIGSGAQDARVRELMKLAFEVARETETETKDCKMLETIKDFVLRVNELDSVHDAYYVFEGECSKDLRKMIYTFADPESPEPFREAMWELGFRYY